MEERRRLFDVLNDHPVVSFLFEAEERVDKRKDLQLGILTGYRIQD